MENLPHFIKLVLCAFGLEERLTPQVIRCEEWLVEWVASTLLVQRDNHNGLPVRQASVGTDEDIVAPTSTRDESGSAE